MQKNNFISIKKNRSILVICVLLCFIAICLLFIKPVLMSFNHSNDSEKVINGMNEKYNTNFTFETFGDYGTWQNQLNKQDTRVAYLFSNDLPNERVEVHFNKDKYFNNPEKWVDNYISVKYKQEITDEIKNIASSVYDNVFIIVTTDVVLPKYEPSITYEQYVQNYSSFLGIYVLTDTSPENYEKDYNLFKDALEKRGFKINGGIYYFKDIPSYSNKANDLSILSESYFCGSIYSNNGQMTINWIKKEG